jgi:hypothetical protein
MSDRMTAAPLAAPSSRLGARETTIRARARSSRCMGRRGPSAQRTQAWLRPACALQNAMCQVQFRGPPRWIWGSAFACMCLCLCYAVPCALKYSARDGGEPRRRAELRA